jgi:hypothetical protein
MHGRQRSFFCSVFLCHFLLSFFAMHYVFCFDVRLRFHFVRIYKHSFVWQMSGSVKISEPDRRKWPNSSDRRLCWLYRADATSPRSSTTLIRNSKSLPTFDNGKYYSPPRKTSKPKYLTNKNKGKKRNTWTAERKIEINYLLRNVIPFLRCLSITH